MAGQALIRRASVELIERAAMEAVQSSEIYSRYAADYFEFARNAGLSAVDPETVRAWAALVLEKHAPASMVPMLAAVKKALRGAAQELASARDAAAFSEALRAIKAPKKVTGAVRRSFVLTKAEERAALAIMTPRDAVLFRFLLATGARISEALAVKLEGCKPDGDMVRLALFGKGGKTREVRVPASLFAEIRGVYGGQCWLFETAGGKPMRRDYAYRRISEAVLKATGKRFSPHGCRHTFATRAIEHTGKLKAVSQYLGHASVGITLDMYVHQSLQDNELREFCEV